MRQRTRGEVFSLTAVRMEGPVSVEAALLARTSERAFSGSPLSRADAGQLLWAAQGITRRAEGGRTVPSAGGLYPLEAYLVAGHVTGLPAGVYRYRALSHDLLALADGDRRGSLAAAALDEAWIAEAPAIVAIAAAYERTTRKYGRRGERYVYMEVGHVAQNVYLEAAALGLGTVFVGAFRDREVARVLELPPGERPLGLMPVGSPPARAAR
jgi:SagB-type dehydrogenase family enzyme